MIEGGSMVKIVRADAAEGKAQIAKILSRAQFELPEVQASVDAIVRNVKERGDAALFGYTHILDNSQKDRANIRLGRAELEEALTIYLSQYDNNQIDKPGLLVSQAEIDAAYKEIDSDLLSVLRRAAARIRGFHQKQKHNSWLEPTATGELLGQMYRPVDSAGIYVPGGNAALCSSVLMNIIPAQVAGVPRICMATPPQNDGSVPATTIVAAVEAGVSSIYKMGGAQAIAALAYGTESVPRVDKIAGPGNIFVALAKRAVFGYVGIDSIAGPSEILILADETANPRFVAADMLSQAEHDALASAILVTTSEALAEAVAKELAAQTETLARKEIINKSLAAYGAILVTDSMEEAAALSNAIAPEHLELCVADAFGLLPAIRNAGAIFLGHYTPEPLGDYMAGPNHVLPTGGTARFFSPLGVDDFVKKSSVLSFTKPAFDALACDVIAFAEAEGLTAHANSVRVRIDE